MHEEVRKDVLAVLRKALPMLRRGDVFGLSTVSNEVIHDASVFQDDFSVLTAVMLYSLSKVVHRGSADRNRLLHLLESSVESVAKGDDVRYSSLLKHIMRVISTADAKTKVYIGTVIEQAQVKKGCTLCGHGISVARAAAVLGVSQWDLMRYLGQMQLSEQSSERVGVKQRLALARRLFP